jgi:cytochrome c oxidase subunit 2
MGLEEGSYVGLQLPKRARRLALGTTVGLSLLLLGSCSEETKAQAERWAMPANSPGTEEGAQIAELWEGAWIAALLTGALVWGLIFYASWAYRRRSDNDIPVQTRYNLPLEIFYTIAPIMMVIVFFARTVTVQNDVTDEIDNPDRMIEVSGQQWSWTFNHSLDDAEPGGEVAYVAGTGSNIPTLVLPVDEVIEFKLSSPDVIHSFWIPAFLMKMDVIPGQEGEDRNSFQVTTTKTGEFRGKCAELCGVYHARMIFDVEVVTAEEYDAYLDELVDKRQTAEEPLLGGEHARTQVGAEDETGGDE